MGSAFQVVVVPPDVSRYDEVLGTKPKFWYHEDASPLAKPDRLFKSTAQRPNEDWSEKVAAELALRLGLPHAHYELATHRGERGVVSTSFLEVGEQFVHGNEHLSRVDPDYARDVVHRAYDYTVERVMAALDGLATASDLEDVAEGDAAALFVGYLHLDAWIGNTDRHHENWGLIESTSGVRLAHTYDHATCLGRELTSNTAQIRLTTNDQRQTVEAYLDRARSAFYLPGSGPGSKPISPLEAWRRAARSRPGAARYWLEAQSTIEPAEIASCLARIPTDRIGASHRALALRILQVNHERMKRV